jgi:hypothetical protein
MLAFERVCTRNAKQGEKLDPEKQLQKLFIIGADHQHMEFSA